MVPPSSSVKTSRHLLSSLEGQERVLDGKRQMLIFMAGRRASYSKCSFLLLDSATGRVLVSWEMNRPKGGS